MAVAKANCFLKKQFGDQSDLAREIQVNKSYVSKAFTIIQYAPELVDSVLAGSEQLNDAYFK
jgi:hypothetical protein